jgi:phage head maturation protease
VRDVARALAKTKVFEQSRRNRKKVEMLFAHLKRILRLGRLRLRDPSGAQFQFTLAAIAQNLRRLAGLVARPPVRGVRFGRPPKLTQHQRQEAVARLEA